jgi:hypothetical protein
MPALLEISLSQKISENQASSLTRYHRSIKTRIQLDDYYLLAAEFVAYRLRA